MDIKILTKNLPGGGENEAFNQVMEGSELDTSQYPPGIYVSERYNPYNDSEKLNAFNMHIVDNNGKVRTLYSAEAIGIYTDSNLRVDSVPQNRIGRVGIDNAGKFFVILPESGASDGLYETYVATTTDDPKLTKQEYANQITQLYRILRTI